MSSENMVVIKEETQAADDKRVLPEHVMRCPRCNSSNTKFCYYNNYSLSQPRHFCKTCRRYWTRGGALRNVPVGGGCRKSKKVKTPTRIGGREGKDINFSSGISGLKYFNGLPPAMDFQLGGLYNHHQLGSSSSSVMGLNYPLPTGIYGGQFGSAFPAMNPSSLNLQTSLASSIESLSSINQDLHWKFQKQRLYGRHSTDQKLHSIFFPNLDLSEPVKIETSGDARKEWNAPREWLLRTSYPASNGGGAAIDDPGSSSWNGVQAWNNHLSSAYGGLP